MPKKIKLKPVEEKEEEGETNWYKSKAVQKLIPDEEPYPLENTDIKVNSRILAVGTTGSGKTNSLVSYIAKCPNTFAKIVVYYKESETLYQFLGEQLKSKIEFHNSLNDLPTLANMRKDMEPNERILLVLDDQMTELKGCKNVNDYFIYGRKKNITLFCLCQSYYVVPKVLRQQMTYLLMYSITQVKDINLILSEFDTKDKVLRDIYKDATKLPLGFLKIVTGRCEPNKRFAKGFKNYYKIENEE